jgi:hypothetical protein
VAEPPFGTDCEAAEEGGRQLELTVGVDLGKLDVKDEEG